MYLDLELFNKYIDWTKLKTNLHLSERVLYPRRREIWWVNLGQNIGVETNGKNDRFERPVLVIKPFNTHSFLVSPISSKLKKDEYIFEFSNNLNQRNIVNLSQLRTISTKRFIRKVDVMSEQDFRHIIVMIKNFL